MLSFCSLGSSGYPLRSVRSIRQDLTSPNNALVCSLGSFGYPLRSVRSICQDLTFPNNALVCSLGSSGYPLRSVRSIRQDLTSPKDVSKELLQSLGASDADVDPAVPHVLRKWSEVLSCVAGCFCMPAPAAVAAEHAWNAVVDLPRRALHHNCITASYAHRHRLLVPGLSCGGHMMLLRKFSTFLSQTEPPSGRPPMSAMQWQPQWVLSDWPLTATCIRKLTACRLRGRAANPKEVRKCWQPCRVGEGLQLPAGQSTPREGETS